MRSPDLASLAVLALALTLSAGCAGERRLTVETVLNYDQCQGITAGLTRVGYAEVAAIRGGTLLNLSGPEEAANQNEDVLLVAISRGQQPTPGYALSVADARRRNGSAVIQVDWTTPPSGAVLPQVLTHPCLVVGMSRSDLSRVEAVDGAGTSLGILEL
jgi:hypothetical protein